MTEATTQQGLCSRDLGRDATEFEDGNPVRRRERTARRLLEQQVIVEVRLPWGQARQNAVCQWPDCQAQEQIFAMGRALTAGGAPAIAVLFDQLSPNLTQEAIAFLRKEFPRLLVGAGMVTSNEQMNMANAAQADFFTAPHMDPEVLRNANQTGMVVLPGCLTPTECARASASGAGFVQLAPAGVLGPAYLEQLRTLAAGPHFFVAGIAPADIPSYRQAGAEGFVFEERRDPGTAAQQEQIAAAVREYMQT
jgi:2-dehydro-3-deoxyphosphogluconate aldolase/(4S)-4-hydroxy-2-oxoglutarate aldolase